MTRQKFQSIVTAAAVLIAAAAVTIALVVVLNSRNEPTRICGAIEKAFKAHDDVFYPKLTERQPPLPPRTAEDQARVDQIIADVRTATDDALSGACS